MKGTDDSLESLLPPRSKGKETKILGKIYLQIIIFLFFLIPSILWSIFKYLTKTPKSLKGHVALVTGSGRGLGRGLALGLAREGCKVACVDIDVIGNEETVQIIQEKFPNSARGYKANVAKIEDIKKLRQDVEKDLGHVDILINNAGIITGQSILEEDEDKINTVISVNLTSHFHIIHQFLPSMLKRNKGHIVAISSASSFLSIVKAPTYSASKWGVTGLMESLAYELDEIPGNNVKTSCACPYFINTSESYTNFWELAIPELTIDSTVKQIIYQMKMDTRVFGVPSYLFWIFHLIKLLPDDAQKLIRSICYAKIKKVDKENTALLRTMQEQDNRGTPSVSPA